MLFHDPVITAAGNVYERDAIQTHLAGSNTDPITGATLTSKQLTPIFLLRSRAMEYAENATHRCLEQTTSLGCVDPVRWLRRAVDLCEETGTVILFSNLNYNCLDTLTLETFIFLDTKNNVS